MNVSSIREGDGGYLSSRASPGLMELPSCPSDDTESPSRSGHFCISSHRKEVDTLGLMLGFLRWLLGHPARWGALIAVLAVVIVGIIIAGPELILIIQAIREEA